MTDVSRINPPTISPTTQSAASAKASAPLAKPLAAPYAPTSVKEAAAAKPTAMSDEASVSSANLGAALGQLSSSPFALRFPVIGLTQMHAVRAVSASLSALNAQVASKGLAANLHKFVPSLAFKDELGRANVRLDRVYDGVPVFGEQVISHLDELGRVADFTGATLPARIPVDTKPSQSPESAMACARELFNGTPEQVAGPRLVIIKTDDGVYHLAHQVTMASYAEPKAPRKMHYFIDAHSGDVLPLTFNEHGGFIPAFRLQGANEPAATPADVALAPAAEGTGNSIYLGNVQLSTTEENGKFVLRDPKANNAETRDAKNGSGGSGSGNVALTDDNNKWGEASDNARARAGIDAQYGAVQFLRYLKELFNRDSLDGKGLRLLSNVHVRSNYVNAYWDGDTMNYGDGDGRTAGPLVDKDVASHEPMHGLTQHTSGLVYRGESGALNEAGSDILGSAGFSWFLRGMKDSGLDTDYLIGEDCWTPATPGDALRYMNDPMRDKEQRSGDMYSRDNYKTRYTGGGDNGGVHLNSGIANNFFFLLSQGGTNRTSGAKIEKGIGMEKALRLYYRAHTVYFTPSTTFAQAREAWIKAATDLFGADSAEVKTVVAAAAAVGLEGGKPAKAELIA